MFGLLNPWLLLGGTMIASPIIIHLLARRRYRIVDWAAMDFLLNARRKNKRRIRLENLLLLLLRCLALILISLALSRVFFRHESMGGTLLPGQRFHRVILLDDSPSMAERSARVSPFDNAKQALAQFIQQIARQRSGDVVTLMTTSRPDRPIIQAEAVTAERVDAFLTAINGLEPAAVDAHFEDALPRLVNQLAEASGLVNKEFYILSDFRRVDWDQPADGGVNTVLAEQLERISQQVAGVVLVDLAGNDQPVPMNLTVAGIDTRDKQLVQGVRTDFDVTVANHGIQTARQVRVRFQMGDSYVDARLIDQIKPKSTAVARFSVVMANQPAEKIQASISTADVLPIDNRRYYAAALTEGVRVLIVDGDRDPIRARDSESYQLAHAIDPMGEVASGNDLTVIDESDLDSQSLNRYQVIFLCNVSRLTAKTAEGLKQWVEAGGGLIYFLGEHPVIEDYRKLHKMGLFPMILGGRQGDARREQYVKLTVDKIDHPVFAVFQGSQNVILDYLKFFSWRDAQVDPAAVKSGAVDVIASLDQVPAMVGSTLGRGRILVVNTTADTAWSNWPDQPTFPALIYSMIGSMTRATAGLRNVQVAQPIRYVLDPIRYQPRVKLIPPRAEARSTLNAKVIPQSNDMLIELEPDQTAESGFYTLELTRNDQREQSIYFAANLDPREGRLERVDAAVLKKQFKQVKGLSIVAAGKALARGSGTVARTDFWLILLMAALTVLFAEQLLAWTMGQRRR